MDGKMIKGLDRYLTTPPEEPELSPQSEAVMEIIDILYAQSEKVEKIVDDIASDYLREKERECPKCAADAANSEMEYFLHARAMQ